MVQEYGDINMETVWWIIDRLIEAAAMIGVVAFFALIALAYGA
uniref:Uncharacterized protein n=1 Tax=viral metagenome TaxID=1070528 RepID=A0A6M3J2D1_9ZZZZ